MVVVEVVEEGPAKKIQGPGRPVSSVARSRGQPCWRARGPASATRSSSDDRPRPTTGRSLPMHNLDPGGPATKRCHCPCHPIIDARSTRWHLNRRPPTPTTRRGLPSQRDLSLSVSMTLFWSPLELGISVPDPEKLQSTLICHMLAAATTGRTFLF